MAQTDSLARVVSDLVERGSTGCLYVRSGESERELHIRDGVLVATRSRLVEEALGSILVGRGNVGPEELEIALKVVSATGRQLGDVLISEGVVTPMDIAEALTEQVVLRFYNCFKLRTFETRYEAGVEPPGDFRVSEKLSPLIVDAVLLIYSVDRILDELDFDEDTEVRPVADYADRMSLLGLGPREHRVVRQIGEKIPFEELVGKSEVSYLTLLRLVYALWALRLVDVGPPLPAPVSAAKPVKVTKAAKPAKPAKEDSPRKRVAKRRKRAYDPDDPRRTNLKKQLLARYKKVSSDPTPAAPPASSAKAAKQREARRKTVTHKRVRITRPQPRDTVEVVGEKVMAMFLKLGRLDYYEVLDLGRTVGVSDVKIAYGGSLRRYRLENPPETWTEDQKGAAASLLARIGEAYAVLSDSARRKDYDEQLEAGGDKRVDITDPMLAAGIAMERATRLRAQGSFEEAARLLLEALEQAPKEPSLHLALGVTLYEQTRKQQEIDPKALHHLATAAKLDPSREEALVYMARIRAAQGEPDKAIRLLRKALNINPQSDAGHELRLLEKATRKGGLIDKLLGK